MLVLESPHITLLIVNKISKNFKFFENFIFNYFFANVLEILRGWIYIGCVKWNF